MIVTCKTGSMFYVISSTTYFTIPHFKTGGKKKQQQWSPDHLDSLYRPIIKVSSINVLESLDNGHICSNSTTKSLP